MPTKRYFFQLKKRNFAQRLFNQGLNAASYILFSLKEGGKDFLRGLPDSYPAFGLMKQMFGVKSYKELTFKKKTIETNLYRLIEDGLISKDPKQKIYHLTDKGKKVVSYVENRYLILKKPWDGKLRIVIFDIPEKRKHWRRIIRQELLLMQFQQLQKSVYVGKYPIPASFIKEIDDAGLRKYIFIFTVDKVDRPEEILNLLKEEK